MQFYKQVGEETWFCYKVYSQMQFYKRPGETTLNSWCSEGKQLSIYNKVYSQMQF